MKVFECDSCHVKFPTDIGIRKRFIGDVQLIAIVCPACNTVFPAAAYDDAIRERSMEIMALPHEKREPLMEVNRTAIRELVAAHAEDFGKWGRIHEDTQH